MDDSEACAIIDRTKIEGYLLSGSHPVGRFEARFFAQLGFTADRSEVFERALREQHLSQPAEAEPADEHGQPFVIRAILRGPAGTAIVVSVWFVRVGEDSPRFVTAYPGGSR